MIHTYKDLVVWQRSIELVMAVYDITEKFPRQEQYGLISQMRRAVISIASNIAEGRHRGTRKDFLQFLRIVFGSGAELETQLEIAKRLPRIKELEYTKVEGLLNEVMRMLNAMINHLNIKASKLKS